MYGPTEEDIDNYQRFLQSQEREANEVYDISKYTDESGNPRPLTVVLRDPKTEEPLGWVFPLISDQECDECIGLAEEAGLYAPEKISLRSGKRTKYYENEDLASRIYGYLPDTLKDEMEKRSNHPVIGIHKNWRIVEYSEGEGFPAHRDQGDIVQKMRSDGVKDLHYSSHTLLIQLSRPNQLEGGHTRFYTHGDYDYCVDVSLPRGWALVFEQKKLLHAGLPVKAGIKHVAQAGILRFLPEGEKFKQVCMFKWGPGLLSQIFITPKNNE